MEYEKFYTSASIFRTENFIFTCSLGEQKLNRRYRRHIKDQSKFWFEKSKFGSESNHSQLATSNNFKAVITTRKRKNQCIKIDKNDKPGILWQGGWDKNFYAYPFPLISWHPFPKNFLLSL